MAQVDPPGTADPLVIVVTGPECTGKSTLARELAAHLDAPVSLEFARSYVEQRGALLTPADVGPIACGQIALEDEAYAKTGDTVVKDTDLVSTVVYAHHYYGSCPSWVEATARRRLGHLYLLLTPDVPWLADGFQREAPEQRMRAFHRFERTLRAWRAHVVEIAGTWDQRRVCALAAVGALARPGRG